MLNRKGQMALFIIGAVIIVFSFVFFIFIDFDSKEEMVSQSDKTLTGDSDIVFQNIHSQIESCVEESLDNAVKDISFTGGYYYNNDVQGVTYEGILVPYYFNGSDSFVPTEDYVKKELGDAVSDKLWFCVDAINDNEYGAELILHDEETLDLSFNENYININLKDPYKVEYKGVVKSYSKFTSKNSYQLKKFLNISSEIVKYHIEDPYYIPVGLLSDLAIKERFYYEIIESSYDTSVIMSIILRDPNSEDKYQLFAFGIKYLPIEGVNDQPIIMDEGFLG